MFLAFGVFFMTFQRFIKRKGQATVEFVMVFMIMLGLFGAMVDVGRGVLNYMSVTSAAREGARIAMISNAKNYEEIGQNRVKLILSQSILGYDKSTKCEPGAFDSVRPPKSGDKLTVTVKCTVKPIFSNILFGDIMTFKLSSATVVMFEDTN